MLHEKIYLKYREASAVDATLLNAKQIQNRHNKTRADCTSMETGG
jgi:hypothetical protein